MGAPICLQGGAEFQPGCESMDAAMLAGSGSTAGSRPVRVLIAPFAGRPGRERSVAADNATRWYRSLGAEQISTAPDQDDTFAESLRGADLLVLPGGSPSRLVEALAPHRDALRAANEFGLAISGASAGAMVLCRWTVLPGAELRTVPGLGLVGVDLVLPHFRGGTDWLTGPCRHCRSARSCSACRSGPA
jgi:cyanophycinase-like exopeptidase